MTLYLNYFPFFFYYFQMRLMIVFDCWFFLKIFINLPLWHPFLQLNEIFIRNWRWYEHIQNIFPFKTFKQKNTLLHLINLMKQPATLKTAHTHTQKKNTNKFILFMRIALKYLISFFVATFFYSILYLQKIT